MYSTIVHILCWAGLAGLVFKMYVRSLRRIKFQKTVRSRQKVQYTIWKGRQSKGNLLKEAHTCLLSTYLAPPPPSPFCLHRQATLREERLGERHGMMVMTAKEEGGDGAK
jgi:hypothetical protein